MLREAKYVGKDQSHRDEQSPHLLASLRLANTQIYRAMVCLRQTINRWGEAVKRGNLYAEQGRTTPPPAPRLLGAGDRLPD